MQDVVSPTMPCRWMAPCCGMPVHINSQIPIIFVIFQACNCKLSTMNKCATHVEFHLHLHFDSHVLKLTFLFHLHSPSPLLGVDNHVVATNVGLAYRWIHGINIKFQSWNPKTYPTGMNIGIATQILLSQDKRIFVYPSHYLDQHHLNTILLG